MAIFSGGQGGGSDNDITITFTLDDKGVLKAVQNLGDATEDAGRKAESAKSGFSSFQATIVTLESAISLGIRAFNTLSNVANKLGQTLEEGLRVENLQRGFDNLQKSIGVDSVDSMNRLQEATRGLVSQVDLFQSANQAVLLGVDDGSGKFQQLAGDAIKLGQAMGIDAKNAVDSLVIGIGRQSRLVLDNLGIIVDTEKAYQDFADTLGVTVNALDDNQKKLAFNAAAAEAVSEKAKQLGDTTETAGIAYQRLSASIDNALSSFAAGFSSSVELAAALNEIGVTLDGVDFAEFGRALGDVVGSVVSFTNAIRDAIPDLSIFSRLYKDLTFTNPIADAFQLGKNALNEYLGVAEDATAKTNDLGKESQKAAEQIAKVAEASKLAIREGITSNTGSRQVERNINAVVSSTKTLADSLASTSTKSVSASAKEATEAVSELNKETQKAAESGGFLDAFLDSVGLSELSNSLIDINTEFGGNLATQVTTQLGSAITNALNGGDVKEGIRGLATGLAGAVGSAIGTPVLGSIAEVTVGSAFDVGERFIKGEKAEPRDLNTLALLSPFSAPLLFGANALFGKSQDAESEARLRIESVIEEALKAADAKIQNAEGSIVSLTDIIIKSGSEFGAGSEFNRFLEEAPAEITNAFLGVGNVIASTLGEGFAQGGQVGASIFAQFEGDIDSLKLIVQSLGLTFEQAQEAMVNAFLAGDSSALEVVSRLRDMEEAFKPGLAGFGQFEKAFENFIASAGEGRVSIKSLKDAAIEFKETGSESFQAFQTALEGSGKFTEDQVSQLFQSLATNGIDSLDKLESASDLALINVIANLQSLGFQFADSLSQGAGEAIESVERLRDTLRDVPDNIEKNLKIRVSTEFDSNESREALRQIESSAPGIQRL